MPGRVSGPDLSPRPLLRNSAQPAGPLPAPKNAQGSVNEPARASTKLLSNTFNQLSAAKQEGVGGRVDLLG